MGEKEPRHETIGRGQLYYLAHPGTEDTFSGYGLPIVANQPELLVGLLMVDRPQTANPDWLNNIAATYGECQLTPMTASGERGLACQMQIDPASIPYLRHYPTGLSQELEEVLRPLLVQLPLPFLTIQWDAESHLWRSDFAIPNELPSGVEETLKRDGYGCLAVESNMGVVHVCHAAGHDIEGFQGKPVHSQWQLIQMPTAPLIRLELTVLDNLLNPFSFESFLNVGDVQQLQILAQLAGQEELHMAFYDESRKHRFTKSFVHTKQQWQQVDEMIVAALDYWQQLPLQARGFDQAKADFIRHYP